MEKFQKMQQQNEAKDKMAIFPNTAKQGLAGFRGPWQNPSELS